MHVSHRWLLVVCAHFVAFASPGLNAQDAGSADPEGAVRLAVSTGVMADNPSNSNYSAPVFLGAQLYYPVVRMARVSVAPAVTVLAAGFVPGGDAVDPSVLFASGAGLRVFPTQGVDRSRSLIAAPRFAWAVYGDAGLYLRRVAGRDASAAVFRRPYSRLGSHLGFSDHRAWQWGLSLGTIVWWDQDPVAAAEIAVVVDVPLWGGDP